MPDSQDHPESVAQTGLQTQYSRLPPKPRAVLRAYLDKTRLHPAHTPNSRRASLPNPQSCHQSLPCHPRPCPPRGSMPQFSQVASWNAHNPHGRQTTKLQTAPWRPPVATEALLLSDSKGPIPQWPPPIIQSIAVGCHLPTNPTLPARLPELLEPVRPRTDWKHSGLAQFQLDSALPAQLSASKLPAS